MTDFSFAPKPFFHTVICLQERISLIYNEPIFITKYQASIIVLPLCQETQPIFLLNLNQTSDEIIDLIDVSSSSLSMFVLDHRINFSITMSYMYHTYNDMNMIDYFNLLMKNNEYIEKYGERALELYLKTKRNSQQHHDLTSEHKHTANNLSKTQKSLKKSKSKDKIHPSVQEPVFTFNKIGHQKNKSKLILSGLSTPKNRASRSNLVKEDRKRSGSTKKKGNDDSATDKLQYVMGKHKKGETKKILLGALECIEAISKQEQKLKEWLSYLKDVVCHFADQCIKYKTKWKNEQAKAHQLTQDLKKMQVNVKGPVDKTSKQCEYILMGENQRLKEKISKMEHKLQMYERKQMVLITALEQHNLRNSNKIGSGHINYENYNGGQIQQSDHSSEEESASLT